MSALDALGRGLAFPVEVTEGQGVAFAAGREKVRQAIWIVLDTEPGERMMRPDFGCGLRRFLMRPNSAATRSQIAREVELSLSRWEPRIRLAEVAVAPGDDPSLVLIGVRYMHRRDSSEDNLVYPFHLE